MEQMWNSESSVVSPYEFKSVVEKYVDDYKGYLQHDSH